MLPTALYDKEQPGGQQNGTTPKLPPPHIQKKEAEELSIILTQDARQDGWSRPQPQNPPLLLTLAAIISIATFLTVVTLCLAWHKGKHVSGITRRRLSEQGDNVDEEQSILEACVDMEVEMGFMGQGATSQWPTGPTHGVEGIASMLEAAANEFEELQWAFPPWAGAADPHSTLDLVQEYIEQQQMGFQSAFQTFDNDAASGLTAQPSAPLPFHDPLDEAGASLDPQAWLGEIPPITSGPDYQQNTELAPSVTAEPDDEGPSTSILTQLLLRGPNHGPPDIREHPHVRVPVLEEGVVPRSFDATNLFQSKRKKTQTYPYLLYLRQLYTQTTLNQEDVDTLVTALEGLAGAAWWQAKKTPRINRPVVAAEAFGNYMLVFDAIVSASQILGDAMNLSLWWEQFISGFIEFPPFPPVSQRSGGIYRKLATLLADAMTVYKKGCRPPLEDVIKLKTMIFRLPDAPGDFKGRRWDPWREDAAGSRK
ncbi:hypothetical protein EAH_00037270 [Eimeria acervulina]|uniref:Uncharacterized protein n=1 Tax=Eimeria acervulina TaxID=5801 RepID=U6GT85_EIMAC|nr:hypothetical protein EAH_00037270 [Eimeria acervulina]CDI83385.1 hypothetical protein EAH_00037270 [Eimeria acervulina]